MYYFLLHVQNKSSNQENNYIDAFKASLNFINHLININYVVQIFIFIGNLLNSRYLHIINSKYTTIFYVESKWGTSGSIFINIGHLDTHYLMAYFLLLHCEHTILGTYSFEKTST